MTERSLPARRSTLRPHLLEPELPPPERLDQDRPLRESFAHLIRPKERFALERTCVSVLELTREAANIVQTIPGGLGVDVAAIADDLPFAAELLAYLGASEGNVLDRWEARLADTAERLAPRVEEIAGELEAAVAASQ